MGFLLCFAASAIMSACNKENTSDNNGSNGNTVSIVGTWECINSTVYPYPNEDFTGGLIVFNDDGNYRTLINDDIEEFLGDGTWSMNGDKLYLSGWAETPCIIRELTQTNLKIQWYSDDTSDDTYIECEFLKKHNS